MTIDATAIPAQGTGVGRYVYNLAAALTRGGEVSVELITKSGDRERWLRAVPSINVHDLSPSGRVPRIVWEQTSLPRALRRLSPKVHHGPHYTMPRRARLPKVVTVHDMTLVDHPEWHERSKVVFFRNAIKAAMVGADVILCDSQSTADRLLAFGQPTGVVEVARLGVDLQRFGPEGGPGGDDAALGRLGLTKPYLAFMGTIEPRKGVPDLVKAFEGVAGSDASLILALAGMPGWGETEAAAAIEGSPYRDRIIRMGFIDDRDVAAFLRQAAAVVYPSLEEGFGLPVLEALACGAPTVTTTGSAMEEYASGAALLVKPGDVDGLTAAVASLLVGDPDLEDRRKRGFAAAAAQTWDVCAAKHAAAYRAALA